MRCLLVATLLCASSLAAFAANRSPEETVVRNTYAKLSYAIDLETVYRATLANPQIDPAELAKQVATKSLTFKLSNFVVGDFASIATVKFTSVFPQYPDGRCIAITSVTERYTENEKTITMEAASAKWDDNGPSGYPPDYTVAQMLPVAEREGGVPVLVRYITYVVTATLNGRSRTYKAAFFFGPKLEPSPADTVVGLGGGPLNDFITKPVYPSVLLNTNLWGKSAAARNFLVANQKVKDSCKAGDACCDERTLQCGVYGADISGRQP
jgi:hypothetical protein